MLPNYLSQLFSLEGKVAAVTGGMGVIATQMVAGLANAGAKVATIDLPRRQAEAEQRAAAMEAAGQPTMALYGDVLDAAQMRATRDAILARWGHVDILVNTAGGNMPAATVKPDQAFADIPREALESVVSLNLMGTVVPSQVFGETMAAQRAGCIVNIASMAGMRAMTQVVGYGAAKAAVSNFTSWLAVELAQKYGGGLRVNAIAPGFFVGDQNRRLLLNEDNSLTERGKTVIRHTPAGRFGDPSELVGTLIWLCSPSAGFVTGITVPVDGGFSSFSGV